MISVASYEPFVVIGYQYYITNVRALEEEFYISKRLPKKSFMGLNWRDTVELIGTKLYKSKELRICMLRR